MHIPSVRFKTRQEIALCPTHHNLRHRDESLGSVFSKAGPNTARLPGLILHSFESILLQAIPNSWTKVNRNGFQRAMLAPTLYAWAPLGHCDSRPASGVGGDDQTYSHKDLRRDVVIALLEAPQ